jgi:hypothetical protein
MKKAVSILVLFLTIILLLNVAISEEGFIVKTDLSEDVVLPPKPIPKLQSSISQIYRVYREQGLAPALSKAESQGIKISWDTIQVVIESKEKTSVPAISSRVKELGGELETSYENLIQARVPLPALKPLSISPDVKLIRKPLRPFIEKKESEGLATIGAKIWENIRFRRPPSPVKVAILDIGFKGYHDLLGSELPESVVARSFRSDNDLEAEEEHGTACAEIIYDLDPDAELYLVNFDNDVENHNAVDYLIEQKVNIISYSICWFDAGAGDGTGPICDDVDRAHQGGILWISAAGNYAERHWEGVFSDPDGDGWTSFVPGDETLTIYATTGEEEVWVLLNWDDWYNSDQDYDLYLMDEEMNIIASSEDTQDGDDWPCEEIFFTPEKTGYYHIGIKKYSSTRDVTLELFVLDADMEYTVPERSICVPADSDNAVAVGATYWWDDSLAPYSSLGPTKDGRIKPDFTAPTGVTTSSYGYQSFGGTSAATPHVAGAISLIRSRIGVFSLEDIYKSLLLRAKDLGEPGKDIKYGYGRLNLGPPEK